MGCTKAYFCLPVKVLNYCYFLLFIFLKLYTPLYVCSFHNNHTKRQGKQKLPASIYHWIVSDLMKKKIVCAGGGYIMQAPLRLNLILALFCPFFQGSHSMLTCFSKSIWWISMFFLECKLALTMFWCYWADSFGPVLVVWVSRENLLLSLSRVYIVWCSL